MCCKQGDYPVSDDVDVAIALLRQLERDVNIVAGVNCVRLATLAATSEPLLDARYGCFPPCLTAPVNIDVCRLCQASSYVVLRTASGVSFCGCIMPLPADASGALHRQWAAQQLCICSVA